MQPRHHPQQRRLLRTVGSDDRDDTVVFGDLHIPVDDVDAVEFDYD
ncbi:hypothetical protein [Halobellus sp. GM3]